MTTHYPKKTFAMISPSAALTGKPKPKKKKKNGVESALSECSTTNHFVNLSRIERWTKRLCSALSEIAQNQGPRGLSLLSKWNDSFENGDGIGEICEACKVRKQVDAKQGSSGSSFL
jgi:hypothetical protein